MWLLAEAGETTSTFNMFDIFMILFTVLIFIGVIRLLKAKEKNIFAIGFSIVSLLVFLLTDYAMVNAWFSG
ncbi:hypothetical protein J2Z69_002797 [Paenibacillus shirakamiensis]|uniref:DUF2759 family protein n=1 Tax=Paenibacillus shirakamiensis TaxID=1265935 RepID=A0ABS4JJ59_9BACL|nr:DUF2759 family protein [Paenibacillus shirakamiensis]MBP2001741.1 hypothetical protein [Paenibacillus shirakamiensis]